MALNRFFLNLGRLLAATLAVTGLFAAEHHGVVKSGGLPIPGATVTAIQADKKMVTTTDEQGAYGFPNLPDGIWTIEVDMLGFAKLTKEVGIDAQAPSPQWELKLHSAQSLAAALAPAPAAGAASTAPPAAEAPKPAPTATTSAQAKPNTPAPTPAAGRGGRGAQNSTTANGRPSLRQTVAQNGGGFQRLAVNQSGDAPDAGAGGGLDAGMNAA